MDPRNAGNAETAGDAGDAGSGDERERVFVAIDIEAGGSSPVVHPLLAVGVCVGNPARGVVERKTWCFEPGAGQGMEPQCVDEFWAKHEAVLRRIRAEARPLAARLADFVTWLDDLEPRFGPDPKRVVFVSNNPAFDLGFLDYVLLSSRARALPLRYTTEGVCRQVWDPSQMVRGQGPDAKRFVEERADALRAHDHWPENDAENIYHRYVAAAHLAQGLQAGRTVRQLTSGGAGPRTNSPRKPPSGDTSPRRPPSGDTSPRKPTLGDTSPRKPTLGDTSPRKPASGDTSPRKPASGDTSPRKPASGDTSPRKPASGDTSPRTPTSGDTSPRTPAPGDTSPRTPAPGDASPRTNSPRKPT